MGPKRAGLVKEQPSRTESPKKKIPVSVTSSRAWSDKSRENTSVTRRRTMSSNPNVSSHNTSNKTPNLQTVSVNQSKKFNQPSTMVHSTSVPRSSSRLHDSFNSNKKTTVGVPKVSSVNIRREKSLNPVPKEPAGSLGKAFGKAKIGQKTTESRLSITSSLHPVAFIRDESKTFKEKFQNKATKSRPTSNKSNASTVTIDSVHQNDDLNSMNPKLNVGAKSAINLNAPILDNVKKCCNNSSSYENEDFDDNTKAKISPKYEIEYDSIGDRLRKTEYDNSNNENHIKFINEEISMDHGDYSNNAVKSSEKEKCISELPAIDIKTDVNEIESIASTNSCCENELENRNVGLIKNNIKGGSLDFGNMQTMYIPSFSYESPGQNEILSDESTEEKFKALIKCQSENTSLTKSYDIDNILDPKTSWTTIDLEDGEISMREMKQSLSETTMKSSSDGKTFILDEPLIILNLRENFREIDREKSEKSEVETEIPFLKEEELSLSASVKSVLQFNESSKPEDYADPSLKEFDMPDALTTPEQCISEGVCDKTTFDFMIDNGEEVFNVSSESDICKSERTLDSDETLEVLDLNEIDNSGNNAADSTSVIIHQILSSDKFPETNTYVYDENDEFDFESEDVVHTVDISNCVWFDCKIQLNKPKPEESEIWVVGEEESTECNNEGSEDMALFETDERDWVVTERNFQELRACLDECREEAEQAARDMNLLTTRNQAISKGRIPFPKYYNNKYLKKGSNIRESNDNDIKITSVSESASNQLLDLQNYNNGRGNSAVADDDIDYFSVSSGDELNDYEVNNISEDNPKKSYLSFGKSCNKMKKKKEKRLFLSFFNLFK